MILADSSVWIDLLRRAGSPAHLELRRIIADDDPLAMTEPVAMELLSGPSDEFTARRIAHQIDGLPTLAVDPRADFREAAAIHRACRRRGTTIRSRVDCLIAAIAIRHDVELLHKDRDFETIAAVTGLRHRSLL